MSRNYYVLGNGRVRRHDNTLYLELADGSKKPLPIEDVESLYLYGEVDLNTRLLNFLSQKKVPLHVFNYYGFYSGSYYPRDYLHSGHLLVHQVAHYSDPTRRYKLAQEIVRASAHSLLRNLAYYERRKGRAASRDLERDPIGEVGFGAGQTEPSPVITDPAAEATVDASLAAGPGTLDDDFSDESDEEVDEDADEAAASRDEQSVEQPVEPPSLSATEVPALTHLVATVEGLAALAARPAPAEVDALDINQLRGIEGKIRERYFAAWPHILSGNQEMNTFTRRVRRPPDNEVNALISFGNGFLYTVCLGEIYRTQLTPTVSYLHEPGARRFSLALDLSEIFKPLIVDRAIFTLLNTGQMKPSHFDRTLKSEGGGCYLTDAGKKVFLFELQKRLDTTIKHRRLGRSVSYRHLIRLECYKLIRHLTDVETYRAFRAWW